MRGKFFARTLTGVTLVLGAWMLSIALGADRTVRLERVVPTALTPAEVELNLAHLSRWALWHYDVIEVRSVDSLEDRVPAVVAAPPTPGPDGELPLPALAPRPDLPLAPGRLVRFAVEPKGHAWKRFFLYAEVTRHEPGRELRLRLVHDTQGKLARVIRGLEWGVRIVTPEASGLRPEQLSTFSGRPAAAVLIGSVEARTASWRGRLFAGIAGRILMHQVLYANFEELGYLKQGLPRPPRRRGTSLI